MQILTFSTERGIHAIFNGYGKQAYIFHSSFYGFVGFADIDDKPGDDKISIKVYLCNGSKNWYWSLKNIVLRGIRKNENQYIEKEIKFDVVYLDTFRDNNTPNFETEIVRPEKKFTVNLWKGVKEVK